MPHFIVIGAGQAGSSLTAKLRSSGFDGDITLIGLEPVPPYQRPPLSKAYLMGDMSLDRLLLRPESFYADQNIALKLNAAVTGIDRDKQEIILEGKRLRYDQLALTTGSDPRRLPASMGGDLEGVHVVRNLADVDAMAPGIVSGKRALIVGGGYIGLEAAAVASKSGMEVTLVEMADRILQRVAAPQTSDYFRNRHQDHGVSIREGIGLKRLIGDGKVTGAELSDGSTLDVDMVIVGVGIQPASGLAEAADLVCENGISTDKFGRTSDPHIWAAGDCASFEFRGSRIRLESVQNAIDQAECVATNMLGAEKPYDPKPWFWSDQYDVKLQIAGLNTGYTEVVIRENAAPNSVSHWYYEGETFRAVDAMNDPRAYMVGKRLLEMGKNPDKTAVQNPETDLKTLMRG
ncbi:MAG: FAD-dependent oxidoreductase [Pseudomonadota bacterium]